MYVVSSLTVFGSDVDVVANPTPENEEFIVAVHSIFQLFSDIVVSLPLYKIYDNKVSRDFKAAAKVL